MRFPSLIAAVLVAAACASVPPEERALESRVDADSPRVIDNILRHEGVPPPSPPLVRELLARPFAALDAASLFHRSVPGELQAFLEPVATRPAAHIRVLLAPYLEELAQAKRLLRCAPVDATALKRELESGLPSLERQRELARACDRDSLERAARGFLAANARFANALRAGPVEFPAAAERFDSAIGVVAIGTRGDDVHGADAALIVDPGGNDRYARAPVAAGGFSIIVDLAGDDRYEGSDVAIGGFAAILDLAGDDAYASNGPGWGAALAGVSLLVDYAGNDSYASGIFGQGAAASGIGVLMDLSGDDAYRLRAAGQGFALHGGLGLLWDRAGNDRYLAGGLRDAYDRGAGISFAQGAATGLRSALGGGIGILRDDAGDDDYAAEMFVQGAAYYYGLGLLWDRGGADRYRAVRYAQGNGVHEAVGVLRDEGGNDRYLLALGVGQGMGLDLAVGLLADLAGDDRYESPALAQGAATANGAGILLDLGGADEWRLEAPEGWGRAEWARGLPSLALLLFDPANAAFLRKDAKVAPPTPTTEAVHESEPAGSCPDPGKGPAADGPGLDLALRALGPGLIGGNPDWTLWRYALAQLRDDPSAAFAAIPDDDFDAGWTLALVLRCALEGADAAAAARLWNAMEAKALSAFAGQIAGALKARPAPEPQMQRIVAKLASHPRCSVRVAVLPLEDAKAAQAALRSSCWRLQARALRLLAERGTAPENVDALPAFLRPQPKR